MTKHRVRRLGLGITALVAALAAGLGVALAGSSADSRTLSGAVRALDRTAVATDALDARITEQLRSADSQRPFSYDPAAARRTWSGPDRSVFVVPSIDRKWLCTILVGRDGWGGGGGCNPIDNVFDGSPGMWSVTSDGGSGKPTRLEVFGIALDTVGTVVIRDADGGAYVVEPSKDGGFHWAASPEHLAAGLALAEITFMGDAGQTLATEKLPAH